MLTCGELAKVIGAQLVGDARVPITHLASLASATEGALSFVDRTCNTSIERLVACKASAVLLPEDLVRHNAAISIVSSSPRLDFAKVCALLHPPYQPEAGIHPSAVIADSVVLGHDVYVGAHVSIDRGARIGEGVQLASGCRIGQYATIGDHSQLGANVVIEPDCHLGQACLLQPGCVIGGFGFGYVYDDTTWQRMPQLGRVVIGDRVEIGANTTIDRGTLDDTQIADDVIIDNQVQIGHNVVIGAGTLVVACVAIGGSATIGARCKIGGASVIDGHLSIADDVAIFGMSLVTRTIREAGSYASATPLDHAVSWRKNCVRFRSLDAMARKLNHLADQQNRA